LTEWYRAANRVVWQNGNNRQNGTEWLTEWHRVVDRMAQSGWQNGTEWLTEWHRVVDRMVQSGWQNGIDKWQSDIDKWQSDIDKWQSDIDKWQLSLVMLKLIISAVCYVCYNWFCPTLLNMFSTKLFCFYLVFYQVP